MFQIDHTPSPSERRSARKELRMRPSDEAKIRRAASAMGLSDTDFIVEAAMAKAAEVERRALSTTLPLDQFRAFQAAIATGGANLEGLRAAASKTRGVLNDLE